MTAMEKNRAIIKESNALNKRVNQIIRLAKAGKATDDEMLELERIRAELPAMRGKLLDSMQDVLDEAPAKDADDA